jgi:hypothetical protein
MERLPYVTHLSQWRKHHHQQKNNEIAVHNFNPTTQKRERHEDGGQDFIFKSRPNDRPSEKHQNERSPDNGQKAIEQGMDREKIATQHKDQA